MKSSNKPKPVIILAELNDGARRFISYCGCKKSKEPYAEHGNFPPFEKGFPLFRYTSPDGRVYTECATYWAISSKFTVCFTELQDEDGDVIEATAWTPEELEALAI